MPNYIKIDKLPCKLNENAKKPPQIDGNKQIGSETKIYQFCVDFLRLCGWRFVY